MMFEHSQKCKEMFNKYYKDVSEWENQWPEYCRDCLGLGSKYESGDWAPYGSTFVQTPGWNEPCFECIEQGMCGRCGYQIFDPLTWKCEPDNQIICPECKWTDEGDNQSKEMVHPSVAYHPTAWGPCDCEIALMRGGLGDL